VPEYRHSYERRRVASRPEFALQELRVKPYELYLGDADTCTLSVREWRSLVGAVLASDRSPGDGPAGFAIAHYARDGNYLLVSSWYQCNMLKHSVRAMRHEDGAWSLSPLAQPTIAACVWELAIVAFERDAWVRTTMGGGGATDSLDQYCGCRIQGWV